MFRTLETKFLSYSQSLFLPLNFQGYRVTSVIRSVRLLRRSLVHGQKKRRICAQEVLLAVDPTSSSIGRVGRLTSVEIRRKAERWHETSSDDAWDSQGLRRPVLCTGQTCGGTESRMLGGWWQSPRVQSNTMMTCRMDLRNAQD